MCLVMSGVPPAHYTLLGFGSVGCVVKVPTSVVCEAPPPLAFEGDTAAVKIYNTPPGTSASAAERVLDRMQNEESLDSFLNTIDPMHEFTVGTSACTLKDGALEEIAAVCTAPDLMMATKAEKMFRDIWLKQFDVAVLKEAMDLRKRNMPLMEAAGINMSDGLQTLLQTSKKRPFLSLALLLGAARTLITGVHKLNKAGLAHLDIKPLNIVLSESASHKITLKFIDFGSALTYEDILAGRLPIRPRAYMYDPPERMWQKWFDAMWTMDSDAAALKPAAAALRSPDTGTEAALQSTSHIDNDNVPNPYTYTKSMCSWIKRILLMLVDTGNEFCSYVVLTLLNVPLKKLKVFTLEQLKTACTSNRLIDLVPGLHDEIVAIISKTIAKAKELQESKTITPYEAMIESIPMDPLPLNTYGLGVSLAEIACLTLSEYVNKAKTHKVEKFTSTDLGSFCRLMEIFGGMMHLDPEKRTSLSTVLKNLQAFIISVNGLSLFKTTLNS